ncbi:hypothetical protein [Actinomadura sp. KC345]|uniref:hypothetical protein n=1 Tax=Actinomadura sp. KC345 TaxID=2530371 RepID=UPI001A9D4065|nr:hypothetical protein [Actinomadura sp. KC345]
MAAARRLAWSLLLLGQGLEVLAEVVEDLAGGDDADAGHPGLVQDHVGVAGLDGQQDRKLDAA